MGESPWKFESSWPHQTAVFGSFPLFPNILPNPWFSANYCTYPVSVIPFCSSRARRLDPSLQRNVLREHLALLCTLMCPQYAKCLIKIDVEGFEEPIFRSAEQELMRLKPRAILFEDQTGAAAPTGKIGAILVSAGYRIFGIRKRLLKTVLVPIVTQDECHFNDYLALA